MTDPILSPAIVHPSAIDRKAALQAQVDALYAEMSALDNAVERETLERGLRAAGAAGCWVEVSHCHDQCVDGELTASKTANDGYDLQKLFGFEGYHCSLDVDMGAPLGRISVHANDGTLTLGVYYPAPEEQPPLFKRTGYGQLVAAKAFLAGFGIRLDTSALRRQVHKATEEAAKLVSTIDAVEAPL